ncbi:MAG: SUMF1/EgtB/PvdO family nonheme iron enzyme [Nanoarchaeota archaeon]
MKKSLLLCSLFFLLVFFLFVFSASAQLTTSSKILIIGDSHLAGPYGEKLYNLLNDSGHDVNSYGCVGAKASSYAQGGFNCRKELGSTRNEVQQEYSTQPISTLISSHQSDIVIVSLGGNFITFPRDPDQAQALISEIKKTGKPCYWIGPPWGPYGDIKNPVKNEEVFEDFYTILAEVNENPEAVVSAVSSSNEGTGGYCKIFDSLKYTNHDFCPNDDNRRFCASDCSSINTCKLHYDQYGGIGIQIAEKWGEAVYYWITRGEEPQVSGIVKPPGAVTAAQPSAASESKPVKGSSQAASLSQAGVKTEQPAKEVISCKSQQRCREIDEVWGTVLGFAVRGTRDIWDTLAGKWNVFERVWGRIVTGETSAQGITAQNIADEKIRKELAEGKYDSAFLNKVEQVSKQLKTNPLYLMSIMNFETGGSFNPCEKAQGTSATGLIQFTDAAASALDTTTEKLCKMSQFQQLDYVKKYFEMQEKEYTQMGPKDFGDLAMAVFAPAVGIGKPDDTVLYKKSSDAYEKNRHLDKDNNGEITKAEYVTPARKRGYNLELQSIFGQGAVAGETPTMVAPTTPIPAVTGFAHSSYQVSGEGWKCIGEVQNPNSGLSEARGENGCKSGMVKIDNFCIDQYEASLIDISSGKPWSPYCDPTYHGNIGQLKAVSVRGAIPQNDINQINAEKACANAGKRLCTGEEWLRACQGSDKLIYPYGNELLKEQCNDEGYTPEEHAVKRITQDYPQLFAGTACSSRWNVRPCMQHPAINQQSGTLTKTGEMSGCKTAEGVYDLVGNVAEWTADPQGTFRGGYYQLTEGETNKGCTYQTTAHGTSYTDYSIGFRCCAGTD